MKTEKPHEPKTETPKLYPEIDVEPLRALLQERKECKSAIKDLRAKEVSLHKEIDDFVAAEGPFDDLNASPAAGKVILLQCVGPRVRKNEKRIEEIDMALEALLQEVGAKIRDACAAEANAIEAKIKSAVLPYCDSDVILPSFTNLFTSMDGLLLLRNQSNSLLNNWASAQRNCQAFLDMMDSARKHGSFWKGQLVARAESRKK